MKLHPTTDQGRLKAWEAVAAVSLITALAASFTVGFTVLTARCFVIGITDKIRKGAKHEPQKT